MKVEYIDHMGNDLTVVNAARVSFNKRKTEMDASDTKLINYLAKHAHWTPFSHPQIQICETVPIFVARQRFKHMVGFTYNEVSRRYVDDEPEFFIPEIWRSRPDGSVKQGSGENVITTITHRSPVEHWTDDIDNTYQQFLCETERLYNDMIAANVAPEQARMVLPQSMYTSYWVTGSLAAWARAYKQRIDGHAQKEIQDLAKQWNDIIQPLYPESWKALTEDV